MSALAIREIIINDFGPRLKHALQGVDGQELYQVVPNIQDCFNTSGLSFENLPEQMRVLDQDEQIGVLKSNISEATQRMEILAQRTFITRLSQCANDAEKIDFIRMLGQVGTDFNCPKLNFERLPELESERQAANIGQGSSVLILGTGSISITGLYFASFGANVTLLDRDPRALTNFEPVYDVLPSSMQQRIRFASTCDARDYEYTADITHIFMAALLEPKEPIVDKIKQVYLSREDQQELRILLRAPREDLMQYFYYDVDHNALAGFSMIDKVDLGVAIQTSVTYILGLKASKQD